MTLLNAAWQRGALAADAPSCENVYVYIVALSVEDPARSTASLALSKSEPAVFRRIGGRLGDYVVVSIQDDWTGLNPKVWLWDGEKLCHAALNGNEVRARQAMKRAAKLRKQAARRRKRANHRRAKRKKKRRRRRRRRRGR